MEEITVTMSLERYKKLESFEKAINGLMENKEFVAYDSGYERVYVLDRDEAMKKAIDDYTRISKRLDQIRKKVYEYSRLKNKPEIHDFLMLDMFY